MLYTSSLSSIPHTNSPPPLPPTHLCKEFLGAAARLDVHQSIMGIFDHSMTEGAHAKLYQSPVI